MAARNHYNVLGVAPDADAATIRAAYRRLARDHHPDRVQSSSAAQGGRDMPSINAAYHVLSDPGRRAVYDRSLSPGSPGSSGSPGSHPGSDYVAARAAELRDEDERQRVASHMPHGPARVPWRSVVVFAFAAIGAIVILAQFGEPGEPAGPDGILRVGDCVEIESNGDAREVRCTGVDDLVVRAFNPIFDDDCPMQTEPHRDRQGMGVACIERPA